MICRVGLNREHACAYFNCQQLKPDFGCNRDVLCSSMHECSNLQRSLLWCPVVTAALSRHQAQPMSEAGLICSTYDLTDCNTNLHGPLSVLLVLQRVVAGSHTETVSMTTLFIQWPQGSRQHLCTQSAPTRQVPWNSTSHVQTRTCIFLDQCFVVKPERRIVTQHLAQQPAGCSGTHTSIPNCQSNTSCSKAKSQNHFLRKQSPACAHEPNPRPCPNALRPTQTLQYPHLP